MPKLPGIGQKEAVRVLGKRGFRIVRQGKHITLHKELAHKLAELERKVEGQYSSIHTLFDAIRELSAPPVKPRREIGFHVKEAGAWR